MIRVLFNDGIMERNPIEVLELLPAGDKLYSELWRTINDRAMRMAFQESETGMVGVYIYRINDEDDPWFLEDKYCTPYGERICSGLAHRLDGVISMDWWAPGRLISWNYRTVNIRPEE